MIIATAGHIDHGKTTLVHALTGIDTDRLPEEKARGISIDIGFAHCTAGGVTLGFVDVPGHERFVRNMLAGVYAVGHVLLVVAADDGVMPQTREHLHIVDLLSVAEGTLLITKKDRVDAVRLDEVECELRELVRGTRLEGAPVFAVSAVSGEGLDVLRDRLVAAAQARHAATVTVDAHARYVVDRVFTSAGSGTVVTGTVIAGSIAAGDALAISPGGIEARARKLQRYGQAVERAGVGERCAINLANVGRDGVHRGDWLVAPEAREATACIDVRLQLLASEPGPLKHWTPVQVHLGAAAVPARLALRRGASISPGAVAMARLRLARPVSAAHGDRLIVRDQSASRTLGGGVVVDPVPQRLPRTEQDAVLAALDWQDLAGAADVLVKHSARGLDLNWLSRVYQVPQASVIGHLPAYALVVQSEPPRAFAERHVAALRQSLVERVGHFHVQHRAKGAIELATLRADVAPCIPADAFAALVKRVATEAGLQLQGSRLRAAGHDSTDNPRDLLLWQRAVPLLMEAHARIPSVRELAAMLQMSPEPLRDLLHRKTAVGVLVKLTPERFALPSTLQALAQCARQTAQSRPDGLFSAADFRDAIGTGRTLAIEILECLDRQGVTQRRGDSRCIRMQAANATSPIVSAIH
jgi:selenocysteine-specific elongation factor